jgi:hypothetical protein
MARNTPRSFAALAGPPGVAVVEVISSRLWFFEASHGFSSIKAIW